MVVLGEESMLKKLFYAGLLIFSGILHAETLFYKKDGLPITSQEHQVLYKIMLETQFPMSAAYGNYYEDEIKTMNEKISKQLPGSGIEATFIPTVLYEAIAFQFKDPNYGYLGDVDTIFFPKSIKPLEMLKAENLFPLWVKLHLRINNYIAKRLQTSKIPLPLLSNDALKIAKNLGDKALDVTFGIYVQDVIRAVLIEYQAYNTGQFVLYRGSNYIDDFQNPKDLPNRSISYGNTLFSGAMHNLGACPYWYMISLTKYGYVIFIDKKQYVQGPLQNMFYIPPLTTIIGWFGEGQLFHARTKIVSTDPKLVSGFHWPDIQSPEKVLPFYQIKASSPEESQQIFNQILQYIKDHHLIFRERKAKL